MRLSHLRHGAVQGWRRFAAWFFRGRYRLLAFAVGLQPEGGPASPEGTLFIEIDGLGHDHLLKAIDGGYMPHLQRLIERGEHRLHRWRCGLAADTPPIQSGLMYGRRDGIVGFYWWDRQRQRRVVGSNPYDMREVQAKLAARAGHDGLLTGGSSYSNIMSGGARWSVLTIAGAKTHWYRPGQGLLRALAILLLNPGKTLRFLFDAAWEIVQEMEDRVFVIAANRPRILEGAFPLVRVVLNVLAREIVSAGTRVDMHRGVPVIYACFIGYDIVAHHSGPVSRNALRVLRGIDAAIAKLLETRAWTERRYRVVILSDHGMSGCRPVSEVFDQSFEEWVSAWWRQGVQTQPRYRVDWRGARRRLRVRRQGKPQTWLSRLAGGVARQSSAWLRTWGRVGAWALEIGSSGSIKLGDRFLQEQEDPDRPRVTMIACGPLAQLWVRDVAQRLDRQQVEALCPGFIQALVDHPAVACVISREGDALVVQGAHGTAYLRLADPADGVTSPPAAEPVMRVEGINPLSQYEEPDVVARQVASFASMPECGDLICFAATFRPITLHDATPGAAGEWHVYSFEHQLGTHASVGGDQGYPFLMLPHDVAFDPQQVIEATDLFPILRAIVYRDGHRQDDGLVRATDGDTGAEAAPDREPAVTRATSGGRPDGASSSTHPHRADTIGAA